MINDNEYRESTNCNDELDNDNEESSSDNDEDNDAQSNSNNYYWCGDIPFGFQTLDPQIFNVIGQILGDVMSNRLPYNVQNSVGNWLQLVGQTIECYSSQQNYFQSGPGRLYNLKYYNVNNPFCPENQQNTTSNTTSTTSDINNTNSNTSDSQSIDEELNSIKNLLSEMQTSIENINEKIKEIEKSKSNNL